MPDIERYTPSQMEEEIQDLAEKYVSAVDELGEDTAIFNDISTAIQSKTGQVESYEKDEMAGAIDGLVYPTGTINISENGLQSVSGYAEASVAVNEVDKYLTDQATEIHLPNATSLPSNFFMNKTSLVSCYAPSILTLGVNVFYQCSNLTTIEINNSIKSISESAFFRCSRMYLDKLPDEVETVANYAFHSCTNIVITKLPNNILTIGKQSFFNCTGIPFLDLSELTTIPTINSDSFGNTTFPFLFRDQAQLNAYASATNWSVYADRFQIKGGNT